MAGDSCRAEHSYRLNSYRLNSYRLKNEQVSFVSQRLGKKRFCDHLVRDADLVEGVPLRLVAKR